jgi:WD40 repeat protein
MLLRAFIIFALSLSGYCWDIVPDPSQSPLALAKTKEVAVPAHPTAVFSSRPSPFVFTAHTQGDKPMVALWHLSMGRVAGPVEAENANWSLMRLSPDGQGLVGWSTLRGKYRTTVWDTKTGKRIWRGNRDYGVQPWRDFAGIDTIVEIDSDLRAWNYRNGKITHEIELPRGAGRAGAVSPAGRYIVLAGHDQKLRFVDLRSSQLLDSLTIPGFAGVSKIRVQGMAFSADGQELAVLLRTSKDGKRVNDAAAIVSWSMKTGELRYKHQIGRDSIAKLTSSGHVPAIACLPKLDGWLVWNAGVVDAKTGSLLGLLPPPPHTRRFAAPTWPLADGRILGHLSGGRGTQPMFAVYDIADVVRKRADDARAGKPVNVAGDLPKSELAGTDWGHAHARLSALKAMPAHEKQVLPDDILQTALADLQSSDPRKAETALEMLARAQPQRAQQPRVLPVLRRVSSQRKTGFIAIAGFWTLAQWQASPVAQPSASAANGASDLAADLASKDFGRVVAAFQKLGDLNTATAAEVVGTHYAANRGLARQTLSKMTHQRAGLLVMLKHKEWPIRVDAVRMLGSAGTLDEISALEALRNDPQRIVQMQVPKAIEQIKKRAEK